MKFSNLNRITITLLAVGAFCPNLHADWGSLRGNNRSAPMQSAPRAQPQQINRAPQVDRTPPVNRNPDVDRAQTMVRPEPARQDRQPVVREQPHNAEPLRPSPGVVDRSRAVESDRRRMDIDPDRRQSFFWSDYHRGMRVDRLPDGFRRFHLHDHDYFYFGGVYYDDGPSGYVVIDPPLDADIPELPPGAETVVVNGMAYYFVDGTFYVQQSDGSYVVVAAPLGVTVGELPSDAASVVVNGTGYFQSGGVFYLPVMQNGVTAYLTVPPP
jgi:hypothetical protein